MNRVYGYLRASTSEQDASRAKQYLESFITDKGHIVSAWFTENESGAKLQRPELFKLLSIAQSWDVLLVEQVDRISQLNNTDWLELKSIITAKNIIIVALDLPTSHQSLNILDKSSDEFTHQMFSSINGMLLDMLAAIARKDYEDRRRRQAEGITKAKSLNKYTGRKTNLILQQNIISLLNEGCSISEVTSRLKCAPNTVIKARKLLSNDWLIPSLPSW